MTALKQEYILKAKYEGQGELARMRADLQGLSQVDAIRTIGKDVRDLTVRFNEAKRKLEDQAAEMRKAGTATNQTAKDYQAAQRAVKSLATALDKKKAAFRASVAAAREAGINTKSLAGEEKRLAVAAEATGKVWAARQALGVRSHKDIKAEVARLALAYNDLKTSGSASLLELFQAKQKLRVKTNELKEATNGWAASFDRARNGAVALAGIGFGFGKMFTEFSSFEKGMAEVFTLVDVSKDKFAAFKEKTKDIIGNLPQQTDDLTKALYDIVSAGVPLEASSKVLQLAAKAATAGVTDTKSAVTIGVGAMNAYGKSVDDLEEIYDVLFQTVKYGVTTFSELSQHMGEVLPTARSAGVGMQEVASATATLTKVGLRTPIAATAIKSAIRAMAAPAPEAKKKFDELGITWDGLIPTLEQIAEKGLSIDEMRMLIPDSEASTGVLALTQNMGELKNIMGSMAQASGSTKLAYQKMADTPDHEIKMMVKSVKELGVGLGELISVFVLPVASGFGVLVRAINESPKAIQIMLSAIGAAITAGVAWKLGVKDIYVALAGMAAKIVSWTSSLGVFTGAIAAAKAGVASLTAVMAANPVTATITVAVLAAAAAWALMGKNSLQASKDHAEAAETIAAGRKEIDNQISSLEKLQAIFRDTAPDSEEHLKAERELAAVLPGANLGLDEQGRILVKVGSQADESAKKLQEFIDKLKAQSGVELGLQLEQQAKAYQKADSALNEYKQNMQSWYGIGAQSASWAAPIWLAVNKITGTYDDNIKKGGEVRDNLNKQKAAWNELLQAMANSGSAAAEVGAALDRAKVSAELKASILEDYRKLASAVGGVGTAAEKAAEKQVGAFRDAAAAVKAQYVTLAGEVKGHLDNIADRQDRLAQRLRAQAREKMPQWQGWKDARKEAEEYERKAEEAAAAGDFKKAQSLFDLAEGKWEKLTTDMDEVEGALIGIEKAQKIRNEGMNRSAEAAIKMEKNMAEEAENTAKVLAEQIGVFKGGWDAAFDEFVRKGSESVAEFEKKLDALTSKPREVTVNVSQSEGHHLGGQVGVLQMADGGAVRLRNMLSGGHFPGFGGGDRRHVVAEDGEYMLDKFRVRDLGLGTVRALHAGRYDIVIRELLRRMRGNFLDSVNMQLGGLVDLMPSFSPQYLAAGGSVTGAGSGATYNQSVTVNVSGTGGQTSAREIAKNVLNELQKMHRGRS